MGVTKKEKFIKKHNDIATIAKAIGHPARVAILDILINEDNCICGDIVEKLPLAQPTISQHLKELRSAGIITGTVEGNAICYCINNNTLSALLKYFQTIVYKLEKKNKICC
jgi:DNA-binding transcriptional ArsR family regulator